MDLKRPTAKHVVIKMTKVKDKEIILKKARGKQLATYKGNPTRLSSDIFPETLQIRNK